MICPHCNQNILYKERSGRKCSKCNREFAFEPKTDALGLHDVRFRKAVAKLSADGKLYFTPGQLRHFLSRKKIKNSFKSIRGFILLGTIVAVGFSVLVPFLNSSVPLIVLALLIAIVFAVILLVFWRTEGNLSLLLNRTEFEQSVLRRWQLIYKQLPPNLITQSLLQNQSVAENARGALICSEPEILSCLSANRTAEDLGLILINPYASKPNELEFVRGQRDLPVFVLHDASTDGYSLKEELIDKSLRNDRNRKVYDIGLRPQTAIKFNLMRLRKKNQDTFVPNLPGLTPEEIAWFKEGNYTPLLALTPTQLIKLVTNAVGQRLRTSAIKAATGTSAKDEQSEAQAVGFMTWLGN